MSITLPGTLSQRTYPEAGDIDDCWAVATIDAATSADCDALHPSMTLFRAAAGKPDRLGPTGGNIDDIAKAIPIIWPGQPYRILKTLSWTALRSALDSGAYLSIAVLSSRLPVRLRFNFAGPHQLKIFKRAGVIWVSNPLAPAESQPLSITEDALKVAVRAVAGGWIYAAVFPVVAHHEVRVRPGWWFRYRRDADGVIRRTRSLTRGFTRPCAAPSWVDDAVGKRRVLVEVLEGAYRDALVDGRAWNVTVTRRS